jgi:hypothetical protein
MRKLNIARQATYPRKPKRRVYKHEPGDMHWEVELYRLEKRKGVLRFKVVPCPSIHVAHKCNATLLGICKEICDNVVLIGDTIV